MLSKQCFQDKGRAKGDLIFQIAKLLMGKFSSTESMAVLNIKSPYTHLLSREYFYDDDVCSTVKKHSTVQ